MSLLRVLRLSAFYGSFQALFDVSLEAAEGETIAVIGANGAGKTTCLRAIAGVLPVPAEAVRFAGDAVGGRPAHDLVARGVVMVPEGRRIFPSLTVEENLLVGGQWVRGKDFRFDMVVVSNKAASNIPVSGKLRPIGQA